MHIRFLEYFVALAQERHFARAARRCNVSQPTLSTGLAALEQQLGKRLVDRDRRFAGLTSEGAAILPWARQIVDAAQSLSAAAESARGPLSGMLRVGIVPAAQPVAGFFTNALRARHAALEISFRALTSDAIVQGLNAFEIDAGLTYVNHQAPTHVISVPLYEERLIFMAARDYPVAIGSTISPQEVIMHPLCLLHQGMQNRRILDEQLAAHGLSVTPAATADSYETLMAMAATGGFATVLPDSYRLLVPNWAQTIAFDPPMQPTQIGLIVADRNPLSAIAEAALHVAETMALPALFEAFVDRQ